MLGAAVLLVAVVALIGVEGGASVLGLLGVAVVGGGLVALLRLLLLVVVVAALLGVSLLRVALVVGVLVLVVVVATPFVAHPAGAIHGLGALARAAASAAAEKERRVSLWSVEYRVR